MFTLSRKQKKEDECMTMIRMAKRKDLDAMIDLWAELRNWEFKNTRYEDDWMGPTVSQVVHLADRWRHDIEQEMVFVALDCREIVGFCVAAAYTPEGQEPECLFVNDVYVSEWARDPNLASHLIFRMGQKALNEGYHRMQIWIDSNRTDNLKEQCIRLGAQFAGMQGMNYSYVENYEWRDLRCFSYS